MTHPATPLLDIYAKELQSGSLSSDNAKFTSVLFRIVNVKNHSKVYQQMDRDRKHDTCV